MDHNLSQDEWAEMMAAVAGGCEGSAMLQFMENIRHKEEEKELEQKEIENRLYALVGHMDELPVTPFERAKWINALFQCMQRMRDRDELMDKLTEPEKIIVDYVKGKHALLGIDHWALKLFVISFEETLSDAENYVTGEIASQKLGSIYFTLQKKGKKSPHERIAELEAAIRLHRDYRGHDRCWEDDEKLYSILPEGKGGADTRLPCPAEMLKHCMKYISSRHDPSKEYVSPQQEIEQLEEKVAWLKEALKRKEE